MMIFPLLSFLPSYLAYDPLGLFLLILFSCTIPFLVLLTLAVMIFP
jgi:hypothetical protein